MALAVAMQAASLPLLSHAIEHVSIANSTDSDSPVDVACLMLPQVQKRFNYRRHHAKKTPLSVSQKKLHCRSLSPSYQLRVPFGSYQLEVASWELLVGTGSYQLGATSWSYYLRVISWELLVGSY